MKTFQTKLQKNLLYNLIIFDFILLESSTKKISNFFIQKFEVNSQKMLKKKYIRMSLEDTTKAFKRFIRLLKFLSRLKKKKIITIIVHSDQTLELLKLLFAQFKLTCFIDLTTFFTIKPYQTFLKSVLILEHSITKSNVLSFFFKKFFLLQAVNPYYDSVHFNFYKIFSSLEDYKKLIFLGLIIVAIFKK